VFFGIAFEVIIAIKNFFKPKFCYLDSRIHGNDNFNGTPRQNLEEFFSNKSNSH
jgi:hypothetical protein